jgi:hypothetical protein
VTTSIPTKRLPAVRRLAAAAAFAAAALAGAACSNDRFVEPNRNQPGIGPATADPNFVQFAATGILAQNRILLDDYVRDVGTFGRESFNYTQTEGRNTSGFLATFSDNAGFGANAAIWLGRYTNLRNIRNFNTAVDAASLSAAEKSAALGFSATMEGLELHYLIATRHDIGIPVEIREDPLDLAPFVSRDSAYNYIVARLNAGAASLTQGGSAFPFTLSSGFTGFTTPTTFRQFNRGLTARVQAYRGSLGCGVPCYQQALAAIGESFIDPAGALDRGVYAVYSTAANDATNALNTFGGAARVIVAHPSAATEFLRKPDGTPDDRYTAKFTPLTPAVNAPGTNIGIPTSLGLRIYPQQGSSVPVMKNEELILLRAEARYFTGNVAGALEDINTIRTRSGGLAAITAADIATSGQFVTELLAQRRWSLYQEGHRWIDHRRFGRLNQLPVDLSSQSVAVQQVVPQQECLSRRQLGLPAPTSCPQG